MVKWLNKFPKLEEIFQLDKTRLSDEQKEDLKSEYLQNKIILTEEQIKGYSCEKCRQTYLGSPKIEKHMFSEPQSGGEVYGVVDYTCKGCNTGIWQARITEDEFMSGFAKLAAEKGFWAR